MSKGTSVVDIDAHFIDHFDELWHYLDEDDPWRDRFRAGAEMDARKGNGQFFPKTVYNSDYEAIQRSGFESKEGILEDMDDLGIDKILLIGQQLVRLSNIEADDFRPIKYVQAYMRHLMQNIVDPDAGIYATLPIVQADPDWAVSMIEEYADDPGVVGAVMMSHAGEPPYGNHRYDPIYEACVKYDLPVLFHADFSSVDDFHYKGFGTNLETHSLVFIIANMCQLTSVVIQGVPERFPNLDIIFQEAGLFYIPMMMYRLDQEYLRNPDLAPLLDSLPSEYMKEFYFGTQPMEQVPDKKYFKYVIEMLGGPERLMWASDWPHPDYDEQSVITELPFLSSSEKEAILGGNAERVFSLN
jgi:predicted TIM-barrel fold metal-dependent hydrolase